ncbi:aspartyl-phosphate phosphatase Spo0E family protein [Bacillus thermotolerans]|uniref:Aspartyl-phosphate phosphatase Spo0E family protein n=1 Tax=Bacillus thermotolerans TaxID=1221996 RepID=A0A0F5HVR3_BACTR|nr:aspartyl-phosphate phosphatase Spo0E family protein [Bacillus thermotolerans]KKB37333.1 hypothetical protein QY95_02884 [Bacillus thermotolerans]
MTQEAVEELVKSINDVRRTMIVTGLRKGLNNDETLRYSKELDKLIHKYQLAVSRFSL